MKKAVKKAALEEANKETAHWVKKHLRIMVIIKALGSLLAQIGLWKAGESPVASVIILPLLILIIGNFIINNKITDERAVRFSKYILIFYCFLVLATVGNVMSFLIKVGFIDTIKV